MHHRRAARAVVGGIGAAALMLGNTHDCHAKCGERYGRLVTKDDRDRFGVIEVTARDLEAALRRWFSGNLTPRVLDGIDASGLAVDLSADGELKSHFLNGTREQLSRLFVSGFNHGVQDVHSRNPMSFMSALTEPARARMESFQSRAFASTTETVTRAVRSTLADGIGQGESIPELTSRAQDLMGSATKYAPERIARTESARAYLTSREDAWKESGVVERKEWLLSADPCEFCEAMAGKYAEVGEAFIPKGGTLTGTDGGVLSIDYTALDTPPAHPGCRCSLGAVFKGTS